jgi:hypothetical protein
MEFSRFHGERRPQSRATRTRTNAATPAATSIQRSSVSVTDVRSHAGIETGTGVWPSARSGASVRLDRKLSPW